MEAQRCDGIGLGAIQDTATVVILDGNIGGIGCMHILDVEGRVVTAPGILEEHGNVGGQRTGREAVVGGNFTVDVRTSHCHHIFIRRDHCSSPTQVGGKGEFMLIPAMLLLVSSISVTLHCASV